MATRVEVSSLSALVGVPGLGEIAKQKTLKQTCFRQTADRSGSPSVQILDGKSPLGSSARFFPQPRLTPKPFSKDKVRDVQSPAVSLRPGLSRPFASAGLPEDALGKALDGKMPTLEADNEGASSRSSLLYRASMLQPNPNPMTVFETTKTGPLVGKGVSEGTREAKAGAPQEPLSGSRPEVAPKPALPSRKPLGTLPRPTSLSEETRPAVTQEEKRQNESPSRASSVEDTAGSALEIRPRLKRRPVSAIFTDVIQPQKTAQGGGTVVGKSPPTPPEKSWVRKPRPLSMDLTARFESKEVLLKKMADGAVTLSSVQGLGPERSNPEPKVDGDCPVKAQSPPGDVDSDFLVVTKKIQERKERMMFKHAEGDCPRAPGDPAMHTFKDDENLQEEKDKLDGEPERMPKSPLPRSGRGQDSVEVKGGVTDGVVQDREVWTSKGSIKKRISLFGEEHALALTVGSTPPVVPPESLSAATESEKGGVSVQDRIKGWAAESSEAKRDQEIRRRMFQMPPSTDSNKMFSSPASGHEVRYEKCCEPVRLPRDSREKQKEGHGASALRSPWKPETLREKARQLEQKDSSNKDPEDCSRGNAVGSPCASNGPLEDDGHFETVWATVFEHHVERHSVADQSRRCLLATVPGDVPDTLLAESKPRPDRVSWLGRPLLDRTNPKKESSRRPENPEAEKMGQTALLNGDPKQYQPTLHLGEKCNNGPFQKHPESQPVAQRVEPKYDIMHTVGTRAHSQAVCVAQEEKAVSLRSSMAGLSQESHMSPEVTGPSPVSSLDGQPWSVQRASLLWEARGLPKPDWKEAKDVSGRGCSSPKWTGRPSVSWNKTTVVHGEEKGSVLNLPGSCMAEAPLVRMVKTSIQEVQAEEFGGAGSKAEGCVSRDQRVSPQGWPLDPPSRAKAEPSDFQAHTRPVTLSVQRRSLAAIGEGDPKPTPAPEPEVRMRKTSHGDQRVERWRRRTLPHNARFEEFSLASPQLSVKFAQRQADHLTLTAGAFRQPQLSHSRVGTQEVSPGNEASPVEAKATFFAVTYQIPDAERARSVIIESEPENLVEHSSKVTPPPSPQSLSSTVVSFNREEPLEAVGSRSWPKRRESDRSSLTKKLKPADHPSFLRDGILDPSSEQILDVDALWVHRGSEGVTGFQKDWKDGGSKISSSSPSKMTPTVKSHTKVGHPVRRKTEVISETFPGKIKDGYRSSVLDIDALMAEYREGSVKGLMGSQDWKESDRLEASSSLRGRPDNQEGLGHRRKSLKETFQVESVWKQASSAETNHSSYPSSKKQLVETLDLAPNTKLSPPLWGPPTPAPEQYLGTSSGPIDPRKTILGVSEEDRKGSGGKHSTSHQSYPPEHKPSRWDDTGIGASDPSRSALADLKKETLRKSAGSGDDRSGVHWGDYPRDSGSLQLDIKRACSEKGPPAHIQEGRSIMQEARERKREQAKGRPGFPRDSLEAKQTKPEPCWHESGARDGHKILPRDPGKEEGAQDNEQPIRRLSHATPGPRRSHSFCKDRRSGPLVDQLNQCFSRRPAEAKDTDTLVQEADSQYGTWTEPRQSRESLAPESPSPNSSATSTRKQSPSSRLSSLSSQTEATSAGNANDGSRGQQSTSVNRSRTDLDSTDRMEGPAPHDASPRPGADDFSFLDQTSVLDSSALKTRVQLSKRSRRRAPISLRRSRLSESESRSPLEDEVDSMWMFKDSTEEKSPRREESDEEEKLPKAERTPVSHPQRIPAFPGMDPAILKAQLHKRQEADSPGETPTRTPQPKTPKSPFQPSVLGSRVLPSSVERDERSEEPSPQWLKELRSKQRRSLYENQA